MKHLLKNLILIIFIGYTLSCQAEPRTAVAPRNQAQNVTKFTTSTKTIRVFVALCDNKFA